MAQILNNLIEVRADRYYPYLDVPPNHPARVAHCQCDPGQDHERYG